MEHARISYILYVLFVSITGDNEAGKSIPVRCDCDCTTPLSESKQLKTWCSSVNKKHFSSASGSMTHRFRQFAPATSRSFREAQWSTLLRSVPVVDRLHTNVKERSYEYIRTAGMPRMERPCAAQHAVSKTPTICQVRNITFVWALQACATQMYVRFCVSSFQAYTDLQNFS